MDKISVLVVSQQYFFRRGVCLSLGDNSDMVAVSTETERDIASDAGDTAPTVTIVDTDGAIDAGTPLLRKIKQMLPDTRLILLTPNNDDDQLLRALKVKASACLEKTISPENLANVVRKVARGEEPIRREYSSRQNVAVQVLQKFQQLSQQLDGESDATLLTPRETEILNCLARGHFNKQIAGELGISQQTVKNHVTSILRKLNAGARTEAVVLAIRQGIVDVRPDLPAGSKRDPVSSATRA